MLKTILSISGKPGLYKLVSQGTNMMIVESLTDKRRIPTYARDRIISLGDIAIYTEEEEVPLFKVLETIKEKEAGKPIPFNPSKAKATELEAYMAEVLPAYDRERVYINDIKKLFNWYNALLAAGITDFTAEEKSEEKEAAE